MSSDYEVKEKRKSRWGIVNEEDEEPTTSFSNKSLPKKIGYNKKLKMSINIISSSENLTRLTCTNSSNTDSPREIVLEPTEEVYVPSSKQIDDCRGFYQFSISEILDSRYRIMTLIGSGVFSTVVRCVLINDSEMSNNTVAVKILRIGTNSDELATKEVLLLQKLTITALNVGVVVCSYILRITLLTLFYSVDKCASSPTCR